MAHCCPTAWAGGRGLLATLMLCMAVATCSLLLLLGKTTQQSELPAAWLHNTWTVSEAVGEKEAAPQATTNKTRTIRVMVCKEDERRLDLLQYVGHAYAWTLQERLGEAFQVEYRVLDEPEDAPEDVGFRSFVYASLARGARGLPKCLGRIPFLQEHVNAPKETRRLHLVGNAGEAFEGPKHCEAGIEFIVDRTIGRRLYGNCTRLHYVQGLQFETRGNPSYNLRKLCDPAFIRELPSGPRDMGILSASRVIKASHHRTDVLVRSSFFALMVEEFGPEGMAGTRWINDVAKEKPDWRKISCAGTDVDSTLCKAAFDFSLDMENEECEGYVSEKIFGGLLSKTVPVYFGAPDIHKYINPRRFINCPVPMEELLELRKFKVRDKVDIFRTGNEPSRAVLVDWVAERLRPFLAPCVAEVRRVHENRTLYNEMVREPPFRNQEAVCAEHPYYYMGLGDKLFDALDGPDAPSRRPSPTLIDHSLDHSRR